MNAKSSVPATLRTRLLVPLLALAGTVFFIGAALWMYDSWSERVRLGSDSNGWPQVPATLNGAWVTMEGSVGDDSNTHAPNISYSYRVDGMEFSNNVIAATSYGFRERAEAEAFVADYPTDRMQAHYNPENPSESVLEPGIPFAFRLLVLMPAALLLCGLLTLWTGLRALFTGKT